jgi:hypothetical protein
MSEIDNLPDPHAAFVEERKIRLYLLNVDHPKGGPKAVYFLARGFTLAAWEIMRDALIQQGVSNPVVRMVDHPFGKRYTVECSCLTPDGSNPCIRSVWEVSPDDERPRLITAHPFK